MLKCGQPSAKDRTPNSPSAGQLETKRHRKGRPGAAGHTLANAGHGALPAAEKFKAQGRLAVVKAVTHGDPRAVDLLEFEDPFVADHDPDAAELLAVPFERFHLQAVVGVGSPELALVGLWR
eukprot:3314374-Alexandrium_andersonii.AAC.1